MTWKYCWCIVILIIIHIEARPSKVMIKSITPIYTSDDKVGLNISWARPNSHRPITSYKVKYWKTGNQSTERVSLNSSQTSYQLKNLAVGTNYSIKVRAVSDAEKRGEWSNISVATTFDVPSKVGNLSVEPVFVSDNNRVSRGLRVSWTPPQSDLNITSYEVQINATERPATGNITTQLTQRSHTLKDLDVGTEYSVRVRAVSDAGVGKWSNISNATTFNSSTSVIQLEVDRGDEPLCLDQDVTLRCKHFPVLNSLWAHDTRANWKVNGNVLTPGGIKYFSRQPTINMTHLKISLKPTLFAAEQILNYSCFLRVIKKTILESNEVSISPLMNPMKPSFMQVEHKLWSVNVKINHNPVCFTESEQCTLKYIYALQAPSQGQSRVTSETEVTLFNLTSGTQYTLNVTAVAVCENGTLNQTSDTASTQFTTENFTDLQSYVVASSPNTSACYGSTFEIVCDHPDIKAMYDNNEAFIDSSVSWRRDGAILTVDDDTYTTVQYRTHSKLLVNYKASDFFRPGIKDNTNNFSCFLRDRDGVHFNSPVVSIEIPGFPHAIKIDPNNDVINWKDVAECVPGLSSSTRFKLLAELPQNNSFHSQDRFSRSAPNTNQSGSFVTTGFNASLMEVSQKIDISKSGYVYVTLQQSQQNNTHLMIHRKEEHACFGHSYTLECTTNLNEFSDCGASQPTWFQDGVKIDEATGRKIGYSFQQTMNTSTLRINVTRSNFNVNHSFYCAVPKTDCGRSAPVSVKPLRRPFAPRQLNTTSTSSNITLTWEHNKACFGECTFNVSIQVDGMVTIDGNYSETKLTTQTNYTFTSLTPSTPYLLTVLAICDNEYSNETMKVSNTTSAPTPDTTPNTTPGITSNLGLIMGLLLHGLIRIA